MNLLHSVTRRRKGRNEREVNSLISWQTHTWIKIEGETIHACSSLWEKRQEISMTCEGERREWTTKEEAKTAADGDIQVQALGEDGDDTLRWQEMLSLSFVPWSWLLLPGSDCFVSFLLSFSHHSLFLSSSPSCYLSFRSFELDFTIDDPNEKRQRTGNAGRKVEWLLREPFQRKKENEKS